ncbi:hypothetical protein SRABI76_03218 [Microbacterium oxydans]|nr:hypothetical protein SRABI76_03218 [Microbacterium oxydans]
MIREPCEVEALGRVHDARGDGGCTDVLPCGVVLAPEGGAPGGVERIERAVLLLQPVAEGGDRVRRIVLADGNAVLVVDVPQHDGRMLCVPGSEGIRDPDDRLAVGGSRVRGHAARAEAHGATLTVDHVRIRMVREEPGRRRGGGGAEVDGDAVRVQQIEQVVEPGEVELALGGLDQCPREDADADQGDPGLAHEHDVLVPGLAGPLLGVVVAAIGDSTQVWPGVRDGHRHSIGSVRLWCGSWPRATGTGLRLSYEHRLGPVSVLPQDRDGSQPPLPN